MEKNFLFKQILKKDLNQRFSGTTFGLIWMFINPLITMTLYCLVFMYIFKYDNIDGIPYVAWLTSGILPWFFYLDVIGAGTMAFIDYKYLITKVKFNFLMLPKIKVINALYVHIFYIIIVSLIALYFNLISIYMIQIVYYLLCLVLLTYLLIKLLATLNVFFRDTIQIVNVSNTFLFWISPVFWSINMLTGDFRSVIMLNPLAYIVEGYRNCFVYHRWFFEDMPSTLVFWTLIVILYVVSNYFYSKLKNHFADVL